MNLRLNPATVTLEKGFTEDKTNKGHWGTGNLDVSIKDKEDFEKAKPLILRAYEEA